MSRIIEILKKHKNYEMEDSIFSKEYINKILSIKKTEFVLTQEKFWNDFDDNIEKYKKKYDDEKIIVTMNNFHVSLKQIFDIKSNKIELIELDNEIINKILLELHNICMVHILFMSEKIDKNSDNNLLINHFSLHQIEQNSLYERKNSDYGDAYLLFGFIGIIVRIQDKIQRLISILNKKKKEIYNESILDNIIDLCNYCVLALMLR